MKYLLIFIPLIFVYIIGNFYSVKDYSSKNIPFKPPDYVFGIVWPILLLLIGYSWFLNNKESPYFIILTVLLGIWIIIYNFSKIYAFINIILTIIFLFFITIKKIKKLPILLLPLIIWLVFASYLSLYSLLSDKPYVSKSNIHGKGLFASKEYKKNDVILENIFPHKEKSELLFLPIPDKFDKYIIYEGKYINHSDDNYNTFMISDDYKTFKLLANKDIKKNEELTNNYNKTHKQFPFIEGFLN